MAEIYPFQRTWWWAAICIGMFFFAMSPIWIGLAMEAVRAFRRRLSSSREPGVARAPVHVITQYDLNVARIKLLWLEVGTTPVLCSSYLPRYPRRALEIRRQEAFFTLNWLSRLLVCVGILRIVFDKAELSDFVFTWPPAEGDDAS